MTGGEKITARMLYKAEIEYRPEFKIMMGTNVRPKITGSDDGIWRRVKMIPFTAQIPANKIDRRLGDKLREEKSGILNWAIAGAIGWYNEGLPPCAAVDYANEEYRKDMDRMQQFVEDCLTRAPATRCRRWFYTGSTGAGASRMENGTRSPQPSFQWSCRITTDSASKKTPASTSTWTSALRRSGSNSAFFPPTPPALDGDDASLEDVTGNFPLALKNARKSSSGSLQR